MEVVILPSATEAALAAARIVARLVRANPRAVIGLATGETQKRVYAELVRAHREDGLDFAAVTTFNVDEFVGIDETHPGSYRRYMQEHLFRGVNLQPDRVHILHPWTTVLVDEEAAARLALADYYRDVQRNEPDWQCERDGV